MKKKHKSALIHPHEKTKRGRKPTGGKPKAERHVKGGILTVHHPPGAPATNGAQERRAVLKWRAMELKTQGLLLREIAAKLKEEFQLEDAPGLKTIDDWLDEAFAEAWSAKQSEADRHCTVIMMRTEAVLSKLLPIALGKAIIARTKVVDGVEIEILDENAVDEMLRAAAESRKYLETQAKLLKIGRVGEGKEDGGALSGQALNLIVEKAITNNFTVLGAPPREQNTLLMGSGDKVIDLLDGEAAQNGHTSESSI